MKQLLLLFAIYCLSRNSTNAQNNAPKTHIYCIHGQGSDTRLFSKLTLDTAVFELHFVVLPMPEKTDDMTQFARKVLQQIDTTHPFVLLGVSLGGMVCVELADLVHPQKTIIISSAKTEAEIPRRYRFMRRVPLYVLMPPMAYKVGAKIVQPLVEPDRKRQKAICKAMLSDKNAVFLKRTTKLIINWKRTTYDKNIIHIHGTNDHTLPFKHVKPSYIIKDGSHMMTLTRGEEMSALLNRLCAL